jgi:hypothetical protein
VVALLDAFRDAHPGAELRLWAEQTDAPVCLYPDPTFPPRNGPRARAHTVWKLSDGPSLSLEVRGDDGGQIAVSSPTPSASCCTTSARPARPRRELTERYEEINLLYFISEILASVLSVPDAATRILTEVADVLGARRASLWVFDPRRQPLHIAAAVGEDGLRGPIPVDDRNRRRRGCSASGSRSTSSVAHCCRRCRGWSRGRAAARRSCRCRSTTRRRRHDRTVGVITLVGRRTNVRFTAGDSPPAVGHRQPDRRRARDPAAGAGQPAPGAAHARARACARPAAQAAARSRHAFEGPPQVAARCFRPSPSAATSITCSVCPTTVSAS